MAVVIEDICECGCPKRRHCMTEPYICIADFRAWWPELIPSNWKWVQADHCSGWSPIRTIVRPALDQVLDAELPDWTNPLEGK